MSTSSLPEILVVDDDKATLRLLTEILGTDQYSITTAASANEAIQLLRSHYFPIVLSDLKLGESDGLELIPYVKAQAAPSFIIFLTGYGSIETAVQAVKEGAFDYLSKSNNLWDCQEELHSLISRALKEIQTISKGVSNLPLRAFDSARILVGRTPDMVNIYRIIAKAANSIGNVLVLGESGTGKERVARAIHDSGPRCDKPFVAVNCCALTETLLESELFGHVKGAFTGAAGNKKGLFEEANGGTLFLDEIGDLSQSMQVTLLRALQEGEIKPVGSTETRKVDVRVIAATHRNLDQYMAEGKFREDLYYRLKVFKIQIPSLKDRTLDIPDLANYFISRCSSKYQKEMKTLSPEALELLKAYPWPGNIRELENAIERAVSMTSTSILYPEDFPQEIQAGIKGHGRPSENHEKGTASPVADEPLVSLEDLEHRHILRVLEATHYNKTNAAKQLGVDRTTLYRKAERYGISLEEAKDNS